MLLWQNGEFLCLLKEAETIQKRLKSSNPSLEIEALSKKFSALMKAGKLSAATKLLTANMQGGVLPLNEETMKLLELKHPVPAQISPDALSNTIPDEVHPVIFEGIDGESIRKAMMNTKGGAGPSGMDADGWRYLILSKNFKEAN